MDGEFAQQGGGAGLADALGALEPLGLFVEFAVLTQQVASGLGEALDAPIQGGDALEFVLEEQRERGALGAQGMQAVVLLAIAFSNALVTLVNCIISN